MKRLVAASLVLLVAIAATATAAAAAPGKGSGPGLPVPTVEALLSLQHPRGLNRFARQVSDPSSAHYRDYATVEELLDRFGAEPRAARRVLGWLAARGIRGELSATRSFVVASIPATRAARILPPADGAAASGVGVAAARTVPAALRGAVTGVTVTTARHPETAAASSSAAPTASAAAKGKREPFGSIMPHSGTAAGCAAGSSGAKAPLEPFTPNQYLTAYGHAALHARGFEGEGQTVAVVEQGGFKRSDIVAYAKCFGVEAPPIRAEVVGYRGNQRPPAEVETTLDLEQLSVAAPGLDRIDVYEAPESLRAILAGAGAALGNPANRPDVISISLGICEPQIKGAVAWRAALDNVFAVAAGAGISVLVSSGDQGSSGCRATNLETEETTALSTAAVSLPSSSPFATAVGGTNLKLSKQNDLLEEVPWNDSWVKGRIVQPSGGGGGLSLLSPRTPWWQAGVHGYGPGRKVPDVSALADIYPGFSLYCTAESCLRELSQGVRGWTTIGGTSAAAPLTAAGIALVNQYAERHGKPDAGFLNPLLYGLGGEAKTRAAAFNDVTVGNDDVSRALGANVVGDQKVGCCSARRGYDWATGWGSIKVLAFARLAAGAYRPPATPRPAPLFGG